MEFRLKKLCYNPPITMDLLSLFHDINGTDLVVNLEEGIESLTPKSEPKKPGMVLFQDHKYYTTKHAICCMEDKIIPRLKFYFTTGDDDEEESYNLTETVGHYNFSDFLSLSYYLKFLWDNTCKPLEASGTDLYGTAFWEYTGHGAAMYPIDNMLKKFKNAGASIGWNAWLVDTSFVGFGFTNSQTKILMSSVGPVLYKGMTFKYKLGSTSGGIIDSHHYKSVQPEDTFYLFPENIRKAISYAIANDEQWNLTFVLSFIFKPNYDAAKDILFQEEDYVDKPLQFVDPQSQVAKMWNPTDSIVIPNEYKNNIPAHVVKVHFDHDPNNCTFCSQTGYVLDEAQVHQKLLQVAV